MVPQNAPDCISVHIHLKMFSGGGRGAHAFGSHLEARPLGTSTPIDES